MGVADDLQLGVTELADFFSREDIISKAYAIEQTERVNRYRQLPQASPGFWRRLIRSATAVPKEHRLSLIALACNTVYIIDSLIKEVLSRLANTLMVRCRDKGAQTQDVQIFTLDHPGLLDDLYQVGGHDGWTARIDRAVDTDIRSVKELISALETLSLAPSEQRSAIASIFSRRVWVFLADNVLSGTSAASDIRRAQRLLEAFGQPGQTTILLCAQIITEKALSGKLPEVLPRSNILSGIFLDDRFSIVSDRCRLFNSERTLLEIRRFCEWFGQHHFSGSYPPYESDPEKLIPHPLGKSLDVHKEKGGRKDFAYGWTDCGYTLVLQGNCPNNTIPSIWYPCIGPKFENTPDYAAIFPRNPSRIEYPKSQTSERLERILKQRSEIQQILVGGRP